MAILFGHTVCGEGRPRSVQRELRSQGGPAPGCPKVPLCTEVPPSPLLPACSQLGRGGEGREGRGGEGRGGRGGERRREGTGAGPEVPRGAPRCPEVPKGAPRCPKVPQGGPCLLPGLLPRGAHEGWRATMLPWPLLGGYPDVAGHHRELAPAVFEDFPVLKPKVGRPRLASSLTPPAPRTPPATQPCSTSNILHRGRHRPPHQPAPSHSKTQCSPPPRPRSATWPSSARRPTVVCARVCAWIRVIIRDHLDFFLLISLPFFSSLKRHSSHHK